MKALVICLSILFLGIVPLVSNAYSEYSKSKIKYVISLDKTKYIEGEEVMISFKFINEGNKVDSLIDMNEIKMLLNLTIKNSDGRNSGCTHPAHWKEENIILKPGEEFIISTPLKFYRSYASVGFFFYFPKDIYKMKGYFDNGKTMLESNEISFEVISPEGMEREVYNEILNINKLSYQDSSEQIINRFTYLLKNYPTSIYMDEVFFTSILQRRINGIHYDSTLIQDCLWFIEKNPDSKNIDFAINEAAEIILYKYEGKEAAIEFILKLKETYPDSHISLEAQKVISYFEQK